MAIIIGKICVNGNTDSETLKAITTLSVLGIRSIPFDRLAGRQNLPIKFATRPTKLAAITYQRTHMQ